ncbi:Abi-alpha family protein [uncultured Phenylobacterium sp.]|uniref:Abi-alpha family protein n=1 Tax=uncultured Phenylobacterium sp. TaxID=349273 RepID=UPI0025E70EC9|nr:Abi-alpha family protein [uncultured Phenylobacterium sp.]
MSEPAGGSLIPVTDEQAKALQEAFKLGGKGLDSAKALGGYLTSILGSLPEDLVGLLGADWIRARRVENMINLGRAAKERLDARGVDPEPVSLSVAIPLLEHAADESREELLDLWARLLAAAMDPARSKRVRQTFLDTLKSLDPVDALVLLRVPDLKRGQDSSENAYIIAANLLGISREEADISLHRLADLGCIRDRDGSRGERAVFIGRAVLSSYGVELLRILSDEPLPA